MCIACIVSAPFFYDFRLMFNGNVRPKWTPFTMYTTGYTSKLKNLSDLDFDLQLSSGSNVTLPVDSPFVISYCLIVD